MRGEEGSELQARHRFSLRTAIVVALLTPNYGSRRLKANRFRLRDARGPSVCHARSRRIACGVGLQAANAVAENRATAATQQQEPGCISCRLTVQCLVIGWTRSTAESAGNIRFQTGDFGSRSRRLTCASQKNNNPDQLIPGGSGGHVMVHRTGSVGLSMGQVSPGDHGICRHAANGAHITVPSSKKVICRKPLPIRTSAERSAAVC
jgi:hypothetical protein